MNCTVRKIWFSILLVTLSLALTFCAQTPERDKNRNKDMIGGHVLHKVLKPGEIPAIFDPEFIKVAEADEYYYASEPLMAVVHGDVAKAYSTWHLDRHEIVNDYIQNKAITVTW